MTRTEQERLVERYLNGEMNSADEQEFFIQVAVDNNLRQTLKAYRIVDSAIRKHRDAVPSRHAELRSKVVDMLKVTSVAQAGPASPPPGNSRTTGLPSGSTARTGSAMFRWIVAAVAALGFTIAGFVVASIVGTPPGESTPSSGAYQKQEGAAGTVGSPAAEAPAPGTSVPERQSSQTSAPPASEQRPSGTAEGLTQSRSTRSQQQTARSAAGTNASGTESSSFRNESPAEKTAEIPAGSSQTASPAQQQEPVSLTTSGSGVEERPLQRTSSDTVKMKIQLGTPQNRRR